MSVKPLGSCLSLQHLDASSSNYGLRRADLDVALNASLTHVDLSATYINKLELLSACKELKYLELKDCYGLREAALAALEECTSITYLNIGSSQISSLVGLEGCSGLLHLDIHDNKQMADLGALWECGACLRHLDISGCYRLASTSSLAACLALTSKSVQGLAGFGWGHPIQCPTQPEHERLHTDQQPDADVGLFCSFPHDP